MFFMIMTYQSKNFENLIGTKGFSDVLLKNHFTLYQGYVTNTNKLTELMMAMVKDGKTNTPEFAEIKRRFGWEFNGMRLHELYFGNMSKNSQILNKNSDFFKLLTSQFGSYDSWEKIFKDSGAMRGIGWVIAYYDPQEKMVFNSWVNEHDTGHLALCFPLLVLDVFEHAYITDYGIKRADYIESFFKAINWDVIVKKFEIVSKNKIIE